MFPALPLPAQDLSSGEAQDERRFRYRIETVDAIFERMKAEWNSHRLPLPAYRSVLRVLLEEESAIAAAARDFPFQDRTEGNFWSRGRLKFPSALRTESERIDRGEIR